MYRVTCTVWGMTPVMIHGKEVNRVNGHTVDMTCVRDTAQHALSAIKSWTVGCPIKTKEVVNLDEIPT